MTADVLQWPDDSIERKAYTAAAKVPAQEINDTNRLGYHVYLFLKGEIPSLSETVELAAARMLVSRQEAVRLLETTLGSMDHND